MDFSASPHLLHIGLTMASGGDEPPKLGRIRYHDGSNWGPWKSLEKTVLHLARGGRLAIQPGAFDADTMARACDELKECGYFRQYTLHRSTPEPRLHFLLHEDATENFDDPQPGYK